MRLTLDSFLIPAVPAVSPADAQARLVALIATHGDMARAAAALVAEAHDAQRKLAQRHLAQAARDMDDAVEDIRREGDWLSLGTAAKLVRIRRATLHAAVMDGELEHRIFRARGVDARHVLRADLLDWHQRRDRPRCIKVAAPPSAA